jgi:hypothetical protein
MKFRIIALVVLLVIFCGCATYRYKPEPESCFPYEQYRQYRGPYCSPLP